MSTIRSNPFPPQPRPSIGSDAGRLAAQQAFFALVGQGQPAAAQPAAPQALAAAPITRAAPADGPQKIARPGSLFDIRV